MKMRVAIIGFGYWGEILFKFTVGLKKYIDYICVVDKDLTKREKAIKYKVDFFESIEQVFEKVDVFIIATWENTHYELVKQCLLRGKHVFVEKPLAVNLKEVRQLVKIARENNLILMVDHTLIYDKSFCLLKKKIERGEIGELLKIDSFRFSVNIIKPFTNVVIDLFPHDVSIFCSLLDRRLAKIDMVNTNRLLNKQCDSAQITLNFGSVVTNSFLSWTYPIPRREMVFYGKEGVLSWEKKDSQTDIIKRYLYNTENKLEIKKETEIGQKNKTLLTVIEAFFQGVITLSQPLTSGEKVWPEIQILENVLKEI